MKMINASFSLRRALCAALCLMLLPLSALASRGDATILRRDDPEFLDSIEGMTASGDTLYLQGESALYVYRAGDSGPTAYAWDADISSFTDEPGLEIGRLTVADGDRLHIFLHLNDGGENRNRYVKTLMGELTLEAGLASASSLREVEWPEDLISHYGSNSYAASCTDAFCAGGVLYLLSYGDRGTEACAIDLDSMDYARLPIEDVQMIVPYINGQVLAATGDGARAARSRSTIPNPRRSRSCARSTPRPLAAPSQTWIPCSTALPATFRPGNATASATANCVPSISRRAGWARR